MHYASKEITLKDGRVAMLREPRREDAAAMLEYLVQIMGETDYLASRPEEFASMSVEAEEKHLQNCIDSPDICMVVCEVEGEIAGTADVRRMGRIKMRHRANLGISTRQKYWGLGIGTAMMEELEAAARGWGVRQMELEMVGSNTRARGLYEKMGFVQMAEHPDAFRLLDGSYDSAVFMWKKL